MQRPMLNGGCGHVILPCPKPVHHALVDDALYNYPLFVNVDRNPSSGVDCVMDLFKVPWDFPDNAFDGALFSHWMEHVPHEIKQAFIGRWDIDKYQARWSELERCQDGWYAIWAEIYRVCTNGSIIHVLSPYAFSQGAVTDPSHCRYLTEHSFTHSMQSDPNSPFTYETGGINFEMVGYSFGVYPMFSHLLATSQDDERSAAHKRELFVDALQTRINVVNDLYVKLKVVK